MPALALLVLFGQVGSPSRLTLVLELDPGNGVTPELAHSLSEAALADIRQLNTDKVLGANDLRAILGFEKQRSLLGCKADTSCFAEIGAAMGAKEIVTGSLATVGDTYLLVLRRIDVAHTKVVAEATRTRKTSDQAGLLTDLSDLARQLFPGVAPPAVTALPPTAGGVRPDPLAALKAQYRAACEQGDGTGCYNLGTFLYPSDPEQATTLFVRGCDHGGPLGCFRAAFVYQTGAKGVKRDPPRGLALLQRACDASTGTGPEGNALDGACLALATYLMNGVNTPADPLRAVAILRKVCDRDNDRACAQLAHAEVTGPSAIRNVAHGRKISQDLCDHGETGACADAK